MGLLGPLAYANLLNGLLGDLFKAPWAKNASLTFWCEEFCKLWNNPAAGSTWGPASPGPKFRLKCTLSAGVALLLDRSCALPDTTPNPTFDEHGRFDHIFTAISNTCKHYTCIVSASCANRDQQAKHVQDRRVAENGPI